MPAQFSPVVIIRHGKHFHDFLGNHHNGNIRLGQQGSTGLFTDKNALGSWEGRNDYPPIIVESRLGQSNVALTDRKTSKWLLRAHPGFLSNQSAVRIEEPVLAIGPHRSTLVVGEGKSRCSGSASEIRESPQRIIDQRI